MAVVLGGVTLNPNLIWADRYEQQPVDQRMRRLLGGAPIVYASPLLAGQNVTLLATEDQGWLTKAQTDALVTLAAAPGAIYQLVVGAETFSVVFRHHEPPALSLQPLIPRAVPLADDFFIGEIRLTTL